jgi:phosphosulfolactate synthase (CoM biosynthesis protein A)
MIEVPGPWVSGVTWSMVHDLTKLLIKEIGPDVNLGNLMPDDILHTEALRVGLGVVQSTVKTIKN